MNRSRLPIILVLVIGVTAVSAKHFWRGETLSASEVKRRWGEADYNMEKFKTGSEELKRSMAYSVVKNKNKFIGMPVKAIHDTLGLPDGFYFKDVFPAYIIEDGAKQKKDTWQIVFLLDRDQKVNDVIVHKNCCDK